MSRNSRKPGTANYEVGYRRPPKKSRWKPGQSGNPRGRTKGAKSIATIFRDLFAKRVTVRDQAGIRKVSVLEAIVVRIIARALQGDMKAAQFILDNAPHVPELINLHEISKETDPAVLMRAYQRMVKISPLPR